ncbi:MAG: Nif3-like dinuclear metal center hexameric protein [Capsulimonadaceae bacterium]|nr:Nif3-like dinuclear metal center hexameric protein [Capsulimonadaceae bacterium]
MRLDDLLAWLCSIAPEESAFPDDPIGLLIRPAERNVARVAVCLDVTPAVAETAAAENADLVICHHPLIYRPLNRIDTADPIGCAVATLVREGISLYAMHTNWDGAEGGINDTLARKLGLQGIRPLSVAGPSQIARIGDLRGPITVQDFAARIGETLDVSGESALRYSPIHSERIIHHIAVCGGAGAGFLREALAAGADAYVTADVRHHEFVDADSRGAILFDAGHAGTERPGMAALASRIRQHFPDLSISLLD